MDRSNYAVGVTVALFVVWMQRNKRWSLMFQTMNGVYKIRSSNG